MNNSIIQKIASAILFLFFCNVALLQEQIGVAAAVNKNTVDLTPEERLLVEAGYKIIQNRTIETDEIGKAQMLLLDGTSFAIGPNSSVTLDKFIYNPKTSEGSLEVSAKGLLRLVGGKVTKKNPALIKTSSAVVGIRGGITIVQTDDERVNAAFIFGEEMTVTPNLNPDARTSITQEGFVVSVESSTQDIQPAVPLTPENLEDFQGSFNSNSESNELDTEMDSESQETDIEEDNTEENNQPEVDEDSIEESGVQENSSDVEPSEILTADDIDTGSSGTLTEENEEQVLEEIQDVVDSTVAEEIAVEQSSSIRSAAAAAAGGGIVTNTPEIVDIGPSFTIYIDTNLAATNFSETYSTGSTIAFSTVWSDDPVTYSLTGSGSDRFSVDASGNIILENAFDYETVNTFNLVFSAADGTTTVTKNLNFTLNNVQEEYESLILRYSGDFNSVVRNGFSASAVRGVSGSTLPVLYEEQIGTTATTNFSSVLSCSGVNCFIPVEINDGTSLNWKYFFPVETAGNLGNSFQPNSSSGNCCNGDDTTKNRGKYESILGTTVSTIINDSEIVNSALSNEFGFLTTNKAAQQISFDSSSSKTATYSLFKDQIVVGGEAYKSADLNSFTNSGKKVIAMAIIPDENHAESTGFTSDYFYPNFIPKNIWSYGDPGVSYCAIEQTTGCNDIENNYYFHNLALVNDNVSNVSSSRFLNNNQTGDLPEGTSLWWQVINQSGINVGLWAQASIKHSFNYSSDPHGSRDDQKSLLNVVISNLKLRSTDTSKYSASDTGLSLDGYHYWSYQAPTNVNDNGAGIVYGVSNIECATSANSGCLWGSDNSFSPSGIMLTSSDPYKSGNMSLSVSYDSNSDSFSTGTFNTAAVVQPIEVSSNNFDSSQSINQFRSVNFYQATSAYAGFLAGILEFDVNGAGNSQIASIASQSNASFTFDEINDDVQIEAPLSVSTFALNNFTSNWSSIDTGLVSLSFGDATNDEAKSAYISKEVFAAEIIDNGEQINASAGGNNNLAGVIVSYNTLDQAETDFLAMPNTDYSTWGFWAMSSIDFSPNAGSQNVSVHLAPWVAGQLLNVADIPTNGAATMSGSAIMSTAFRLNQSGSVYDVHKYISNGNVQVQFNWDAGGNYTGTFSLSDYDETNPIAISAGITDFNFSITGLGISYSGNKTNFNNGWGGSVSAQGLLYGSNSPDESGGRINVSLSKTGDINIPGANDFYFAEGIFLVD
ncbi:FecR domain-containing protein [Gammaproteobacteria bacterium]|nr:FecR domain-containing protein [Gammaproteobacteria bacterium]